MFRSLVLPLALAAIVQSQMIDLKAIDAFPDPILVSAPLAVVKDTPVKVAAAPIKPLTELVNAPKDTIAAAAAAPAKRRRRSNNALAKRDGDCSPQPTGAGPVPTPDTADAFTAFATLQVCCVFLPLGQSLTRALGYGYQCSYAGWLHQCLRQQKSLLERFQLYGFIHAEQLRHTWMCSQVRSSPRLPGL